MSKSSCINWVSQQTMKKCKVGSLPKPRPERMHNGNRKMPLYNTFWMISHTKTLWNCLGPGNGHTLPCPPRAPVAGSDFLPWTLHWWEEKAYLTVASSSSWWRSGKIWRNNSFSAEFVNSFWQVFIFGANLKYNITKWYWVQFLLILLEKES